MNTIDLINEVAEFTEIHEFMHDEELDDALALIVKIMANPDINAVKAVPLIAKLQAYSAKFGLLATWYTTVAKGPSGSVNHTKKNLYYSMRESLDKLVEALKYSARYGV